MNDAAPPEYVPSYALYGERLTFPDVLHIETISERAPDYGWVIAPHRHGQLHQIFLIESGAAKLSINGQYHAIEGPTVLNIPRDTIHEFSFAAGTSGFVLTIPTHELPEIYRDGRLKLENSFVAPCDSTLSDLFILLHQESAGHDAARAVMLRALALQVACRVMRLAPGGQAARNSSDQIFDAFRQLVLTHHTERWQIARYAAALNISRTHLHRVCREATGLSALAYVEDQSVKEACNRLAYTKMGISQIGYDLGYEDPSYFSRAFKRKVGLSPKDYRARLNR